MFNSWGRKPNSDQEILSIHRRGKPHNIRNRNRKTGTLSDCNWCTYLHDQRTFHMATHTVDTCLKVDQRTSRPGIPTCTCSTIGKTLGDIWCKCCFHPSTRGTLHCTGSRCRPSGSNFEDIHLDICCCSREGRR